jgi:hypothetical protein
MPAAPLVMHFASSAAGRGTTPGHEGGGAAPTGSRRVFHPARVGPAFDRSLSRQAGPWSRSRARSKDTRERSSGRVRLATEAATGSGAFIGFGGYLGLAPLATCRRYPKGHFSIAAEGLQPLWQLEPWDWNLGSGTGGTGTQLRLLCTGALHSQREGQPCSLPGPQFTVVGGQVQRRLEL